MRVILSIILFFLFSILGYTQKTNANKKIKLKNTPLKLSPKYSSSKTINDSEIEIVYIEEEEEEEKEEDKIYVIVDEMPMFNGGSLGKFRNYVISKLKYPEEIMKKDIQGRVILSFVVDVNGNVKRVKILRGLDHSIDAEVVRVVKSSPKWKAGKQKNKPVNVQYSLAIYFASY